MKLLFALIILTFLLNANNIYPIDGSIKERMIEGGSWHKGCPVPLEDLRYLTIKYINFAGKEKTGELIVHKSVAKEVSDIFEKLYKIRYPIFKMKLISYYNANNEESMRFNNTSAFNCKLMTGSKTKWAKSSYGKVININPMQNPYVAKDGKIVQPVMGRDYIGKNRSHALSKDATNQAMIIDGDKILSIFKSYNWKWGGEWKSLKDYQHFEKIDNTQITPKQLFKSVKVKGSNDLF